MQTLTLNRPDDWHVHLRDDELLEHTVPATSSHFARALVMPNLVPALSSLDSVIEYRQRILSRLDATTAFVPYMTLYLNNDVAPTDLQHVKQHPYILGGKYYPAGATTNSEQGAHSICTLYPLFEMMQDYDLVLQIHGEVTHGDIFNREALFIKEKLIPLIQNFPKLRIVMEHISSKAAVDFIMDAPANVAATITPHHLFFNRNDMLAGGIKPHYYCLPILKKERDQKALLKAAFSGLPKFFAGTDSAPHAQSRKENACGCAGIYSAPFAVAIYAHIFDMHHALNQLNPFMSHFGAHFYQLPIIREEIEIVRQSQTIPLSLPFGKTHVVPIAAGQTIEWSVR